MSLDDAKKFAQKAATDPEFREKLRAASNQIIAIAQEAGLDITADELRQVLNEQWGCNLEHPVLKVMITARPCF